MEVANRIRDFLSEEILLEERQRTRLTDHSPLLSGAMDSLGLMQLVAFLEEEFGIEVDDEDLTPEHFRTVSAIEQLVREKVHQR